ncbi:hypothetical protein C4A75_04735 [Brevibacillus laterosporus]|uniref:lipase/acyltransferase domain-containing protein n=1 Tax=Brevibacillus laterosporus TaxID=1465 RepID=UPI000CE40F87|nr:hypothetical protein [Brevibacillus laterosporus]PPA86540.1 hypothetical protein C4A75_04735 [Brevibacillus laterosporus]
MRRIVFIPGIMGSVLKIPGSNSEKWPVLLSDRFSKLDLETTPEVLEATPVLKAFGFKFYDEIVNNLSQKYGLDFVPFGYDWRHSLDKEQTFKKLYDTIRGAEDIVLIAHSMGGLLVRMFVEWLEKQGYDEFLKISRIVTIATPWKGSPEAVIRLLHGIPHPKPFLPLTSAWMVKEVASTLPSVFQLLPHYSYLREHPLVYESSEKRDLRSDEVYEKTFDARQKQMLKKLNLKHYQDIIAKEWPNHIGTFAVIGQKNGTINYIYSAIRDQNGNKMVKEKYEMSGGDLTVPTTYALPYDDKTICRFIKATHQNIVSNKNVLDWIDCILKGKEKDLSEKFESLDLTFSGKVIKVACPVDITIYKEGQFFGGEAQDIYDLKEQLDLLISLNEDSDIESTLYDEIMVVGETTFVITEEEEQGFEYKIIGKEEGLATIEVKSYEEGNVREINSFPSVQVRKGTVTTLQVDTVSLITDEEGNKIIPHVLKVDETRVNEVPITSVQYLLEEGKEEIKLDDKIIIQSPIKFVAQITGITEEEYLETRMIANNKNYVFDNKELVYIPEPGLNKIVIYSISKYGMMDSVPFEFEFIYDCEAPRTQATAVLFSDRFQLFLYGKDDSQVRTETYLKLPTEEKEVLIDQNGYKFNYNGSVLHFYSRDVAGNVEDPQRCLRVPNEEIQNKIFLNGYDKYNELLDALEIPVADVVEITRNSRIIKDPYSKITHNPKNISFKLQNGDIYTLVFKEEAEVMWTEYPTEILRKGKANLKPFRFQLVTREGFKQDDKVKVRIVPKTTNDLLKNASNNYINIHFKDETKEYEGFFGLEMLPSGVNEGSLEVRIGNKVFREAKFIVL